ncbi:MAG: sensor histidine kinase [Microbacteriaceae bacterium]
MRVSRWWHISVVGVTIVVAAVTNLIGYNDGNVAWGFIGLGVFLLGWFALGQFSFGREPHATIYAVFLILIIGFLTACDPSYASMQAVIYPLLWSMVEPMRRAVVAVFGVAISVFIGLAINSSWSGIIEAAVIAGLSLSFSLAMGMWISGVFRENDARKELLVQLQAAQASLAALSRDAGVTSERERLAREIHDTIAQDLTGLVLLAQQAQRLLGGGQVAAASDQLALLEENARLALSETRALVAATSPAALDDGGIAPALERLAVRFIRETGINVSVRATDATAPLDRATEVVLLRCAQEGLANIRKHAFAHSATLTLSTSTAGTSLTIDDDGSGFDPQLTDGAGFGITGMRDRLALVDGSLDISSSAAGTRLVISLPTEVFS